MMQCPNCGTPEKARVKVCRSCGEAFANEDILEFHLLDFLIKETASWDVPEEIVQPYIERFKKLADRLQRHALEPQEDVFEAVSIPSDGMTLAKLGEARTLPEPAPALEADTTPETVAAPAAIPTPKISLPPKPVIKPKPKPKRPRIRGDKLWEKIIEGAVSGLLLRWLRYLGAFLFVVSLAIVVVNFWNDIPQWGQVAIIFFIPTAFYGGGWFARKRLQVEQTGTVLMGMGQLLLAVDFAAIYQFGGLSIDLPVYWLISSVICTLIYIYTVWRQVQTEFFGYISLAGISSTAMAASMVFSRSIEWPLLALVFVGTSSVITAQWLSTKSEQWAEIAKAARRFPLFITPIALGLILFVPGDTVIYARVAAFGLATASATSLAWWFPQLLYTHLAVWVSLMTIGIFLSAINLPFEWYASAVAILSPVYIALCQWLAGRLEDSFPQRAAHLLAFKLAGYGLLVLAILLGAISAGFDYWAGVSALALVSIIAVGYAIFLQKPLFVLGASILFLAPASMAILRWLIDIPQRADWLMAAWSGLTLVYLGIVAFLKGREAYTRWLSLVAQILSPVALFILGVNALSRDTASSTPPLVALGGFLGLYILSAFLHDSDKNPSLSNWVNWLPEKVGKSIFLYPIGILIPIASSVAWAGSIFPTPWLGPVLAGIALVYVAAGQLLHRHSTAYRFPLHFLAYFIGIISIGVAYQDQTTLMTALYINIATLAPLAAIYNRLPETILAGILFIWPFQISLNLSTILPHAHSLAYILLAGAGYVPLGLILKRKVPEMKHHRYLWVIGYSLSIFALIGSYLGRFGAYNFDVPWVGLVVPLLAAILYAYSAFSVHTWFAWASAAVFPIAFGQALTLWMVPPAWDAVAWVDLGIAYLVSGWVVSNQKLNLPKKENTKSLGAIWYKPLSIGAWLLVGLGIILTIPNTASAFINGSHTFESAAELIQPMTAQWLAAGFVIMAAIQYRKRWPLFLEPILVFLAVTMLFIGYGESIFKQALTSPQFGILWAALGAVHVTVAIGIEQFQKYTQRFPSYMHGIYFGGYFLMAFAILWAIPDQVAFLCSLGIWAILTIGSAILMHFERHLAWGDTIRRIFRERENTLQQFFQNIFIWLAAWTLPIWVTVFLWQINIVSSYGYLGYGLTAIGFLILAVFLRKQMPSYALPLILSGQFFTVLALIQTASLSGKVLSDQRANFGGYSQFGRTYLLGYILVQATAVMYYALSSWFFQNRKWIARVFSYTAAGLSIIPYTLAWTIFKFDGLNHQLGYTWIGLGVILLGTGFALDWLEQKKGLSEKRVGYAHGPYLVGYLLTGYATFWTYPNRLVHIYTFAGAIGSRLLSHIAVHYQRHTTWVDFQNYFFSKANQVTRDVVRGIFLWVTAYSFPIWLSLVLAYNDVPMAWRGLALALTAPIYIAFGLAVRKVDRAYSWPLYSAGYLLTAIGAMVSFDDQLLTIYVLSLNAVVYAASAYIFRQSTWLYFSTILVPVISLITLTYNQDALSTEWVAGIFMGLAFVYFGIGQLFDRKFNNSARISPFAVPFYAPGYLLSAIAIAVASGQRELAVILYLSGSVLYGLSAGALREGIFLYPAVWLLAVPYYLGMTYTRILPEWYGIGWLPLIITAILAGKFGFHRKKDLQSITHSAMPFYTLAYTLSLSMLFIARSNMTALMAAFAAAAIIYLGSSVLFQRAVWLYPGLLAAHLALLTYFAIDPPYLTRYITLPFLTLTWIIGLIGGVLRRRHTVEKWAVPFLAFTALDIIIWQVVAFFGFDTAIIVSTGHAILLAVLAVLWVSPLVAWGSLSFLTLGILIRLAWLWADIPILAGLLAGIGFGFYLVGRLVEDLNGRLRPGETESSQNSGLAIFAKPLTHFGIGINTLGAGITLLFISSHTTQAALGLAFAGALYLAVAYKNEYYRLGYAAVAMLELAFVLLLIRWDILQPQWYAIPAGLYFIGIGVFERRRNRTQFALLLESLGLAIMLVTSFIQSLNLESGFWYFLLLLVEGLLILVWGAQQRRKIPFLIGLVANVVNTFGQIVVVFLGGSTLTRWLIFGSVGLILLIAALFAERWIVPRAREFREQLENWE